jgi:hypothetical protein
MSPSLNLDDDMEFYYNFYLTAVVVDSTCLPIVHGCTRITHPNRPGQTRRRSQLESRRYILEVVLP